MATRRQATASLVIGATHAAARIVAGADTPRHACYSFGALSQAAHDKLLAVLRAALLSGGTEGSVAMTAPGGDATSNLQGGQSVADALAQERREQALLQTVAQTTTQGILQTSAAARALGL